MSLKIEEVISTLRELNLPAETIIKVENELEQKEAELKAEKSVEKGAKQKSQLTVVLLDPENKVKGDVTAFVFKQPEENDASQTIDKAHQAIYAFNRRPKAKGAPISNFGNVGDIKRKFFREQNISLMTREPVQVLVTQGPIPTN